MNRYVAAGLIDDMRVGKRVIFVAENWNIAREAFYQVSQADDHGVIEQVHRTRGEERILAKNGGFVRFVSYNSQAHRGLNADIVFLHGQGMDAARYTPVLATRSSAAVIRA